MKRVASFFLIGFWLSIAPALQAQTTTDKPLKVKINHIAVYVFDLEKSKDFYQHVVQLKLISNPFNDSLHEWFSIGEAAQLHLIKGAKEVAEHLKNSHICFSVASMDDFIANLKKYNTGYINWAGEASAVTTRVDGIKQIYFKDPDGYWVEVNSDYK